MGAHYNLHCVVVIGVVVVVYCVFVCMYACIYIYIYIYVYVCVCGVCMFMHGKKKSATKEVK